MNVTFRPTYKDFKVSTKIFLVSQTIRMLHTHAGVVKLCGFYRRTF